VKIGFMRRVWCSRHWNICGAHLGLSSFFL
jgi:hypothetical protein